MSYTSETSKCRKRLAFVCAGEGLDVGFGGDPIRPEAICIDLVTPYAETGRSPQHLSVNASPAGPRLRWFRDDVLDYVFSSHLIEDFHYPVQVQVLNEFLRVLKPGGLVVLYQPDQQIYAAHCERTGQPTNLAHKERNYSLCSFKRHVLSGVRFLTKVVHEAKLVEDYSWEIVIKKIA